VTPNPLSDLKNDLEPVYGRDTTRDSHKTYSRPVGRPSEYDPSVCDKVIEWGLQGYSKTQMCRELGISRNCLYEWAKAHTDFNDTLLVAMVNSEAFWEDKALDGIDQPTKEFNTGLFGKIMSARFPETYRETTNTQHSGLNGGPIPLAVVTSTVEDTPEFLRDHYKSVMDGKNVSAV